MNRATVETIRLVGGAVCLDFVNTVVWTAPGKTLQPPADVLETPDALVRWGTRLGILGSAVASAGAGELDAALALRSTVHETFASLAGGNDPGDDVLSRLQTIYASAADRGRIEARGESWPLTWPDDDPRSVRFAVAADAIRLLGDSALLPRVRQCPGRDCGGLFLDRTGRRRWCSMELCGSREKMRRLYERQRTTSRPALGSSDEQAPGRSDGARHGVG